MLHNHIRKNRLFHRGHIRSVTVWQHYLCTVCVWMSGKVRSVLLCSNMWTCVCCCPLHPVCECMTDRCQACHSNPGCCGWDVWGQWEMEAVEERDGERVCHSGFSLLWHASSTPYCLSVSADDWQRNCSATDRYTSWLCLCLRLCVCVSLNFHGWMQELTH